MGVKVRTRPQDPALKQIVAALGKYATTHPTANITVYRHSSVSIRIRIIDPTFRGMSRTKREDDLWAILERVPEDVVSEISVLLLFTPGEAKKSFANVEFDDPIPSPLP